MQTNLVISVSTKLGNLYHEAYVQYGEKQVDLSTHLLPNTNNLVLSCQIHFYSNYCTYHVTKVLHNTV